MSSTVSKQGRITTRQLTMTALFVALIAVGAFIRVPLPNCPFTLQILFTTLAGIVLGSRLGAASVGIYIVLGLIHPSIFDKVNYFFGLATFMLFWATLVFVLHLIFGEKICKFKRLFFKKGLK